jgi:hypothetical protein
VTARRDLVPFAVTLIAAAGFVLTVARWSRPATPRAPVLITATTRPSSPEPLAPQRDTSPPARATHTPPVLAAPSPRVIPPGSLAPADGGGATPVGLDAARAQLDALRARIAAIDVDAGGSAAVTARRVLATATAPVIYEVLGEGAEGFEGRYEAYRRAVGDGGVAEASRAQHLRPEDLARAALLDELGALLRPPP